MQFLRQVQKYGVTLTLAALIACTAALSLVQAPSASSAVRSIGSLASANFSATIPGVMAQSNVPENICGSEQTVSPSTSTLAFTGASLLKTTFTLSTRADAGMFQENPWIEDGGTDKVCASVAFQPNTGLLGIAASGRRGVELSSLYHPKSIAAIRMAANVLNSPFSDISEGIISHV